MKDYPMLNDSPANNQKIQAVVEQLKRRQPVLWENDLLLPFAGACQDISLTEKQVYDAKDRLTRFAPFFASAFPETTLDKGIIESDLKDISGFVDVYNLLGKRRPEVKRLLIKKDSHLPISGSVKARGGIYEVLCLAERIALQEGMWSFGDDYSILNSDHFRNFFNQYSISVGSTGNLGLSIGIIGAKLGFKVTVHMSSDARKWKMDKLRSLGVVVVEHRADYSAAVAKGRKEAEQDPKCHFVDDENSTNLFLGYAVGGLRLKAQLENLNVEVNEKYPLCVHLPCGVGGAPGGITFGLKLAFGDNVHCYFAEPVDAPCMTLGLATGLHDKISIQDIGLTTTTEADGLAVGRPSGFVGKTLQHTISGCYTVSDEDMFRYITMLNKYDNLRVEPSAAAGFAGPTFVDTPEATHIIWATGGAMVPKDEMSAYLLKGAELIKS